MSQCLNPPVPDQDDERLEEFLEIVRDGDFERLRADICNDQYFGEPLYHIANQGSPLPNLDPIVDGIRLE